MGGVRSGAPKTDGRQSHTGLTQASAAGDTAHLQPQLLVHATERTAFQFGADPLCHAVGCMTQQDRKALDTASLTPHSWGGGDGQRSAHTVGPNDSTTRQCRRRHLPTPEMSYVRLLGLSTPCCM